MALRARVVLGQTQNLQHPAPSRRLQREATVAVAVIAAVSASPDRSASILLRNANSLLREKKSGRLTICATTIRSLTTSNRTRRTDRLAATQKMTSTFKQVTRTQSTRNLTKNCARATRMKIAGSPMVGATLLDKAVRFRIPNFRSTWVQASGFSARALALLDRTGSESSRDHAKAAPSLPSSQGRKAILGCAATFQLST